MKFINSNINPTTANYPGFSYSKAISFALKLNTNAAHMQLCPQQIDYITEDFARLIQEKYSIQFRCHANTKFYEKLFIFDASSDLKLEDNLNYVYKLKTINNILKSPLYSYHAGKREISLLKMKDNVLFLQDFLDVPVAVEGLYPNQGNTWLLNSWTEYEWLLNSGLNMAIDLSHIQIIAKNENYINIDLIRELLISEKCLEVHISSNNLIHDNHRIIKGDEFWISLLNNINLKSVIFSEENFNSKSKY